jgi:hypothetical protein
VITVMREWITELPSTLPLAGLISACALVLSRLVKSLPGIIHAVTFWKLGKALVKRRWSDATTKQVIELMQDLDRNAKDRELTSGPAEEPDDSDEAGSADRDKPDKPSG